MPEWMSEIARQLAPLRLRPEREREIADELAAHLDDRYSDARGRGMSHDDARAAALAELGDMRAPASAERGLVNELRRVLNALDPTIPLYDVHSMQDAVDESLSTRRVTNILLGGFALTALLLAVVGIYGVMSLAVSGRSREFGIRLAFGGQPGAVRTLVLRQAMWLALAGIGSGLLGALATTRLLGSLLFGVGPLDWIAFTGAAATLTIAALVASYVPARRATRADPMMALRAE